MSRQRLLDLLVDDATQGLDHDGHLELQLLLGEHRDVDPAALEQTVALMHVAFLAEEPIEPMPAHLRDRLRNHGPTSGDAGGAP